MEQAVGWQSNSRATSSARMAWLYEFEQTDGKGGQAAHGTRLVERAVDRLLAIELGL